MPVYQSYPPSLYGLPASHDLDLVGTPQGLTLTVDFTWDSQGKAATLHYGDGQQVTSSAGMAVHTYATHDIYTATVTSGGASDSATLDLSASEEDQPEPGTEQAEAEDEPQEAPSEAESF